MSTQRRVRVWPAVLIVLGVEAAGLTAVTLISYLTEDTSGALRWVLPAVVAFGFAMIKVGVDLSRAEPAHRRADPRPGSRPGRSIGVVMIVLLLLAGSGILVGLGARAGYGWLTGKQDAVPRLAEPAENSESGLGLEVTEVLVSRDFTRVAIAVINNTENTVVLPLYQNCLLTAADTTLEASTLPTRGRWSETVPVATRTSGTIVFDGPLPAGAERAELSFGTVFRHGFDGPDTIAITLPLRE
ncbi:hypothetical protein [Microlunatus speluncae]|uniref:hypothetical protein n=1 Tax=Microlunatus speluncae TaxID=2594267 RepID=UPI0012664281|nr:hypothetical protein [Microlunatus speluncae]